MENWWNAPLWWRERQFHSFLLIKYNLSRQKQEKYYERYLKGMLPITIEGQYYDLGCFCFISCPCTIPVNAIDKAQDWKNDWTFFEGLNLLKAASHAHCLMWGYLQMWPVGVIKRQEFARSYLSSRLQATSQMLDIFLNFQISKIFKTSHLDFNHLLRQRLSHPDSNCWFLVCSQLLHRFLCNAVRVWVWKLIRNLKLPSKINPHETPISTNKIKK